MYCMIKPENNLSIYWLLSYQIHIQKSIFQNHNIIWLLFFNIEMKSFLLILFHNFHLYEEENNIFSFNIKYKFSRFPKEY